MDISIFGLGYVGCVSLGCLAHMGHHIIGVDVNRVKVDQINSGKPTIIEKDIDRIVSEGFHKGKIEATGNASEAVLRSEISIVAVGTPGTEKGHLDLRYLYRVSEDIAHGIRVKDSFHIVVIRSTVRPGTCDMIAETIEKVSGKKRNRDFAVVDNPEFLREGSAVYDFYHPPVTLIGSDNREAAEAVAGLYRDLSAEIIITELRIAEIMKYVNNTFHALKISFSNEIGNICKELGIDSHKVMEIFCKDKQLNISPYYLKPGFAYGGSCLPKDLKGLQTLAHDLYVEVPVIENIERTNKIQIQRAINILLQYRNKRIGFLGLSFKAGTDDLRNSPAVEVIETLLGKGYDIAIYDRNINLSLLTGTNKAFIEKRIPHLEKLLVKQPSDLLADREIIVINNKEREYLALVKDITDRIIIDFVRLDDSLLAKENYIGINW